MSFEKATEYDHSKQQTSAVEQDPDIVFDNYLGRLGLLYGSVSRSSKKSTKEQRDLTEPGNENCNPAKQPKLQIAKPVKEKSLDNTEEQRLKDLEAIGPILNFKMAENTNQATAIGTEDDPTRGLPYHEKLTQDLKILLQKKRVLDRNIAAIEDSIYKREGEYMDDTPHGNILSGFDNYIKGTSGSAPLGRRKQGVTDADRIFSRSSTRFNDAIDSPGPLSAQTTPSAAPTPANSSFPKGDVSNAATPTSATSANKTGAGQKKVKRSGEDSETDTKDAKKARTAFGVSRK